mgnify:CR=1 FL=1
MIMFESSAYNRKTLYKKFKDFNWQNLSIEIYLDSSIAAYFFNKLKERK